jgi:glycosyltransferase involved in cell wall biosynthesis
MASLVGAWQSDPKTAGGCNLLIVGGDLDHPTRDEDAQLELIDALIPRDQGPARGLLLAGHRPNPAVAIWLAAVRRGRPGRCAPNGVYVCASHKEEFGIAILEAMASGLVVVAPCEGGPATYVEPGVTGLLVDTHDPDALGAGLASALALAKRPDASERAERAEALIAERYSIETMAAALATVYSEVSRDAARHQS